MKLAHVLPILSLAAPIACRRKPETWPPGLPGDDMKHLGTDKYIRPPPGWKAPSEKEKKAREEWIAVHRSVTEALEDFMFETTRPKARDEEQLNLGMLSVQAATARAADGILTLEGPYIAEKCEKAMMALDAPTLACSDALGKEDKERLAENIRDLRLMFTVYDYNFSQRCVNEEVGSPSLPLPLVEDILWHFKMTAERYAGIDEYCRSKGLHSSDIESGE
ncbi:uncharacterized protein FFUJ_03855 [Fusarium fujikuroi IMI 58289]|uniref:Uncharacterized protein n=1 Tax=Gibberella fujikuroi (strain CBS 195.34 / IMI 58289 / NRRL A-6831) TaxID=1279085 RepID=S0DQN5_GIBF5|nr:uncharacterized protein FFUJ_03855 [Fusarium fujikuroi IMI 58289]CCT64884.1 uncharacterized protein FFUJ_03855 [Fusarium fujikuroi IMI 58289]SCN89887.1 uncharacterized protein FFM5_04825 [Fusarium fujikuroi]